MKKRIDKARELLIKNNLDGMIITSRANTLYMSGFPGSASLIAITKESAYFITDFRYIEFAQDLCNKFYDVKMYKSKPYEFMNDILTKEGIKTLGFEDNEVTYQGYTTINNAFKGISLKGIQSTIDELRIIKDDEEIKIIKRAVKIADDAFSHILKYIKEGVREIEIANEIEYFMKQNGAQKVSFESIVASGTRSSLPHGSASEKRINLHDPITMDTGAQYNGYCSDMTRTVFLGEPTKEMKKIYETVLEAQLKSEASVKKGLYGKDIDSIARKIIYDAGYEGRFGHGLGHGVGVLVHEQPRLSQATGNTKLENKMVVTVEPGIYIPNVGGVRIEDMVVVNDNNPIVLTQSPKELIIL